MRGEFTFTLLGVFGLFNAGDLDSLRVIFVDSGDPRLSNGLGGDDDRCGDNGLGGDDDRCGDNGLGGDDEGWGGVGLGDDDRCGDNGLGGDDARGGDAAG